LAKVFVAKSQAVLGDLVRVSEAESPAAPWLRFRQPLPASQGIHLPDSESALH
jgi:hypothetical protein